MAQTILTCAACQLQAGLQWTDEEPPVDGCPKSLDGKHEWTGGQRIRLVSLLILPDDADPDGFADSVSEFLAMLSDPQALVISTTVEYDDDCDHPEDEQRSHTEPSCGKCGKILT